MLDAFGVDAFEANPLAGTTGGDHLSRPRPQIPGSVRFGLDRVAPLDKLGDGQGSRRVRPVFDAHLPCAPRPARRGARLRGGPDDPGFEARRRRRSHPSRFCERRERGFGEHERRGRGSGATPCRQVRPNARVGVQVEVDGGRVTERARSAATTAATDRFSSQYRRFLARFFRAG